MTFRPDAKREKSPTSAARARAEGRPHAPRAHGRDDGRSQAGGPGDPLGPGPRLVAGDLGRLGGRQRREAVPCDPASPRSTGRSQFQKCWHRRLSGLPVGVRPSHDMPCRHRIAPARWRAASRTQARSPVARSGSRSPPARPGAPWPGRPPRPGRAAHGPPASRPSFLPGRESAGPGGLGEATGPAGVSPRAGIRAGTSPRGRPRTRRGTAVGGRPPARPSPRSRCPRTCESPARRPRAPARISSWLTGGCRFRSMHDR